MCYNPYGYKVSWDPDPGPSTDSNYNEGIYMLIKCSYCDNFINDTEENCPHCGAPNEGVKRTAGGVPHTIEELKAFVAAKKIPVDKFCFHIGENYQGPKAFGIYKDEVTGNFVVYKNKTDGSRSVRYEGSDEAYAVNEIYQKLKEQVSDYRSYRMDKGRSGNQTSAPAGNSSGRPRRRFPILPVIIIIFIAAFVFSHVRNSLIRYRYGGYSGYTSPTYNQYHYDYNGIPYMFSEFNDTWYGYDDDGNTFETVPPAEFVDNADDYFNYVDEYNSYTIDSDWDDDDDYSWSWDNDDSSRNSDDDNSSWSWNNDDDDDDWGWNSNDNWNSDWNSNWNTDWNSNW